MRKNKLARIFFIITGVLLFIAFLLFGVHTYIGTEGIRPKRNLLPPSSHFLRDNAREFNIAIMSDSGSHNHVLEQVIDTAKESGDARDFIMYIGDFTSDRRVANFYWMFMEINQRLGTTPFYMIPGNHDVEKRGNIDKRYYRAVVGPTYYWFGYGNTLFIAIDTSDYIDETQFEWLDETLRFIRPLFRNCIIFSHMPPKNPATAEKHRMSDTDAKKFESIIRGHKIDAIIAGHVHYFSKEKFAGIPLYTTPSSGQTPRFTDRGKYGYLSLKIGPNGIKSITPKYIEFNGPRREYIEAWLVRYVLTERLSEITNIIIIAALIFAIAGIIAKLYNRRQR